jgi:hypothetical protein
VIDLVLVLAFAGMLTFGTWGLGHLILALIRAADWLRSR